MQITDSVELTIDKLDDMYITLWTGMDYAMIDRNDINVIAKSLKDLKKNPEKYLPVHEVDVGGKIVKLTY